MVITCVMSVPISYRDKDGKIKRVALRPGSHNYPMLNHKDPLVAEQLRVFQKHNRIGFDEILTVEKPVVEEPKVEEKPRVRRNKKTSRRSRKAPEEKPADQGVGEVSEE